MHPENYMLELPTDERKTLALGWLWLCVLSLLGAGVFSLLLVLSRTPWVQDIFPWVDFFHSALVVHVDLSVLVWSLAFAGIMWTLNSKPLALWVNRLALALAVIGTLAMVVAPFSGDGNALMSNYVPVLQNPVFFTGLLLFAAGFLLLVIYSMITCLPVGQWMTGAGAIRFGLNAAAISAAVALWCFLWSYVNIPGYFRGETFFELLFWGGGHVIQFTYTLLMLVAWLWLSSAGGLRLPLTPRVVLVILAFGLICVFIAPLIHFIYPVTTGDNRRMFTWLMSYGGSLATFPLSLALVLAFLGSRPFPTEGKLARACLLSSLILFASGGVIGFLIEGSDVRIPAHYHGCIVGVTLALMGLCYELLPRLGYPLQNSRLALAQPWTYGGGQLLHIIGLVWSGGYGVQRKVAGSEQHLDSIERIAGMGLMGLGGLVSTIGGVFFIIVVIRTLLLARGRRSAIQLPV